MARRRFIARSLLTSASFLECSHSERLLFIGLILEADDAGVMKANATEVKALIFPADSIPIKRLEGWLLSLNARRLIQLYQQNGQRYLEIPKFGDHQDSRYVKPSKYPRLNTLPDSARIGQQVEDDVDVDVDVDVDDEGASRRSPPVDEFEIFWKAYPKKRAKVDALDRWKKTAKVRPPLSSILAALERQKASREWTREGGKWIPWPQKWLRGQRWEDDLTEAHNPDLLPDPWEGKDV